MLFQVPHYLNQCKDPVKKKKEKKEKSTFTLRKSKNRAWVGNFPETPGNFFKGYCDSENMITVEYL